MLHILNTQGAAQARPFAGQVHDDARRRFGLLQLLGEISAEIDLAQIEAFAVVEVRRHGLDGRHPRGNSGDDRSGARLKDALLPRFRRGEASR